MKRFTILILALFALIAPACGGSSSTTDVIVGGGCETAVDCETDVPADSIICNADGVCEFHYTEPVEVPGPSCKTAKNCKPCTNGADPVCDEGQCSCTATETIEVPVEVPAACESAENCGPCPDSSEATCLEDGLCYCQEQGQVNQECYPLTRGEFIQQLMEKYLGSDWDNYVPSVDPNFSDVPTGHEYFKAVQAAVEFGFIDASSDFRPYDHLNRAEGAKLVVSATDGLIGYTPPAQPSYYDVDPNTWFFDYVEAITAYGWSRGYVNSDGTSTGYYGPADTASSCFVNELMAHAQFPDLTPDQIAIAIDQINFGNRIAVAGTNDNLSVRYRVHYTSAAYPLKSLRVFNQPNGEGTPPVANSAISRVWITCSPPSGTGTHTVFEASLNSNGVAYFNNLNCWDETGDGLSVQIVYEVSTFAAVGEGLSGQLFRLVLDDDRLVDPQYEVPTNVVRKTRLTFANVPMGYSLHNGEVTLISFSVSAHPNGSAGLARLVFTAEEHDDDGDMAFNMAHLKFYRGAMLITVNIMDQNGQTLTSALSPLETPKFIVSFPSEEFIGAGTTQIFTVKATASGVETDDAFTASIDFGDEDQPVFGKTSETTPNTARLISSIDTVGLFPYLNYFLFSTPADRNVIWTDWSRDQHTYSLVDSGSSPDFTNGFGLELNDLVPVTIFK